MEEENVEIHGDLLETVFGHVPLVNLVSAAGVSKTWSDSVISSLHYRNKPRPWLIIHEQSTRPPYGIRTRAYDPRSGVWIKVSRPPIGVSVSDLRSSNSNFVYMFSSSSLSFSSDVLNLNWRQLDPPTVWRVDPVVAQIGDCVVVAGGGCDFEDDPMAVEIYDLKTGKRRHCDSMPVYLRDSVGYSLSVAVISNRLIVTHKGSGLTHWIDPGQGRESWSDPFNLDPGEPLSWFLIGSTIQGLILVGVCSIQNTVGLKVWKVNSETFSCVEIGEMPVKYVNKLRSETFGFSSLNITTGGNTVYVYNDTWDVKEVVACEIITDDTCKWWSVRHVVAREEMITNRFVYSCSAVGINELCGILGSGEVTVELL